MSTPVENTPVEEKDKIIKKWEKVRGGGGCGLFVAVFGSGIFFLLARGSYALIESKNPLYGEEWDRESEIVYTIAAIVFLVLAVILLIVAIRALISFIKKQRLKNLPVVLEYEKKLEIERKEREEKLKIEKEERERKEREEELARYRSFEEENAKHVLIVCADAHFNGHYDSDGYRQVFVDGSPYGDATPWAVLGLPGGTHSVFVRYMESVNGNVYQGNTATRVINTDEKSKIFVCDKTGTTIYSPTVYDINELREVVLELQHRGTPPLDF